MTDFVAGDRVNVPNWDGPGKVLFGPYSGFGGKTLYLIERSDNGRAGGVVADRLSAAPAFAVGDAARDLHGQEVTIVAGPFNGSHEWYVTQGSDGKQYSTSVRHLAPVAKPARTFDLNGTIFDLDACYADQDGDVWEFTNGLDDDDQTPIMRCGPDGIHRSLSGVVSSWGPLTAVDAD